MNKTILLTLTISLILFFSGTAWSGVTVSPYLTVVEEYTDNLFLSSDNDKQDDWITTAQPGLSLLYDVKALNVDIDYSLRIRHYANYTEGNETELRDVQRSSAHALFFPGRDFSVTADAEISRVSIDERGSGVDESELVNTTNFYRYSVNPQYVWKPLGNFTATLGFLYTNSDYGAAGGDDNDSYEYSLLLINRFSSYTDLHLNYVLLYHRAEFSQDFDQETVTAGFTSRVGPRLTFAMDGGPVLITYPDDTKTKGRTWSGSATYRYSESISLGLSYTNDYSVSVSRGQMQGENVTANLDYQGRLAANGSVYWSNDEYLEEVTEDRRIGGAISIEVPHGSYYHTNIFYNAEYRKFLPENEEAAFQSMGINLGYRSRRVEVSIGYELQGNDSTIDVNDYWNNVVTLNGNLRF